MTSGSCSIIWAKRWASSDSPPVTPNCLPRSFSPKTPPSRYYWRISRKNWRNRSLIAPDISLIQRRSASLLAPPCRTTCSGSSRKPPPPPSLHREEVRGVAAVSARAVIALAVLAVGEEVEEVVVKEVLGAATEEGKEVVEEGVVAGGVEKVAREEVVIEEVGVGEVIAALSQERGEEVIEEVIERVAVEAPERRGRGG